MLILGGWTFHAYHFLTRWGNDSRSRTDCDCPGCAISVLAFLACHNSAESNAKW